MSNQGDFMKRKILFLMAVAAALVGIRGYAADPNAGVRGKARVELKAKMRHSVQKIKTAAGTVDVEIYRSSASVDAAGKKAQAIVVTLFEPKSGLYWWTYQKRDPEAPSYRQDPMAGLLGQYKWWATSDAIVGFRLLDNRIVVIESRMRQPNIDKVLGEINETLANNIHDADDYPVQSKEIPLIEHLGLAFFRGTKLVAQWRPSRLVEVDYKDGRWTLKIDGPDGEHGSVVLDNQYKVIESAHENAKKERKL